MSKMKDYVKKAEKPKANKKTDKKMPKKKKK